MSASDTLFPPLTFVRCCFPYLFPPNNLGGASQVALLVKTLPASAGDVTDMVSIPGLGRSPRQGNGNPLQYSCLENPMDRGAWWATVHGVTKSWRRLKQLSTAQYRYFHNPSQQMILTYNFFPTLRFWFYWQYYGKTCQSWSTSHK